LFPFLSVPAYQCLNLIIRWVVIPPSFLFMLIQYGAFTIVLILGQEVVPWVFFSLLIPYMTGGTILILRWVPMVYTFVPTILCLMDKWGLFFTQGTGMLSFLWLTCFFTEAFFLIFGVRYIFELLQVSTLFLSLKFPVVKPLSSHVRCFILVICPSRQVYLQVVFKVTVLVFWV